MATDRAHRIDRAASVERVPIGELVGRIDLAALMDHLVPIAFGSGTGRRWQCPDHTHEDQHPSVTVRRDRSGHERWRCWSGGHRGDAVDLVRAVHGLDHRGAVAWLAEHARFAIDSPRARPPSPDRPVATAPSPAMHRYVRVCEAVLWGRQGDGARDWLARRGFTEETLRANHVGADPGRTFMPRPKGLAAGYGPGVTFPALDPAGQIVYVQTRALDPNSGPKYTNPAATQAPNPRLAWTVTAGPTTPELLLVCEGIPDALAATQGGFRAVALVGAFVADRAVATRLALEADHATALVWVGDADDAGRHAAERLRPLLAQHGHDLAVVEPPVAGWDLNDWTINRPTSWADQLSYAVAGGLPAPAERLEHQGPDLDL